MFDLPNRLVPSVSAVLLRTREHSGATRQHGVGVQVLPDVHVALHDGVVGRLVDASRFHAQERGLEQSLGAPEPLVADGDDLSVGQLVALLEGRGGSSRGHFLFEVQGDVAQLLLYVPHDLTLSGGGEGVTTFRQNLECKANPLEYIWKNIQQHMKMNKNRDDFPKHSSSRGTFDRTLEIFKADQKQNFFHMNSSTQNAAFLHSPSSNSQ